MSDHHAQTAKKQAINLCRAIMAERGLTQVVLARKMKKNNTYVSDVFCNRRGWSPGFVKAFCKATDLNEDGRTLLNQYGARANGWDV